MEKNRRGKTSRFDNSHQIFFIPAQTGFRRHHNGPRKLFGLQKPKKPYADARKAAEIISRNEQARLIFGDELIRTETFYRQEAGEFSPSSARQSRLVSSAEQIIIDAKEYFEERKTNQRNLFPPPAFANNGRGDRQERKIIIFANRKGYSPTTICADCHRTILCDKCDTPAVMRKTDSKSTVQRCHRCLAELPAPDRCPYCKSWRLESYGIGTQMVAEEMRGFYPNAKILRWIPIPSPMKKPERKSPKNFCPMEGFLSARK